MALPSYKEIVELLKKGLTVEAQEQIMALREAALTLQEENLELRERVNALENALAIRGQMRFDGSTYWVNCDENADGPFCQRVLRCRKQARTATRLGRLLDVPSMQEHRKQAL
jgi:hypothetical protein